MSDAYHRQHRGRRNGSICPCCREADKKTERGIQRARLAVETRAEVDEGAAAWAYRRRAQAPVCDPPCEECLNEMEDDV